MRFALFLLLVLFLSHPVHAAEHTESEVDEDNATAPEEDVSEELDSAEITEHEIEIDGETIAYTATAGTITLRDKENEPTASIFYIAYTRSHEDDLSNRPVTFSFNGGPGSSSVWLHMGLLGPRRVVLEEDGSPVPPPYRMEDNEFSLLDKTDLVFIDPVSTGYSRAADPENASQFHGVNEDIRSVADFIRLYVTRNERWLVTQVHYWRKLRNNPCRRSVAGTDVATSHERKRHHAREQRVELPHHPFRRRQ